MFERTIKKETSFTGLGIHTGKTVSLTLKPSTTSGIRFFRTDCDNACVRICAETLRSQNRATAFQDEGIDLLTPEHLLAALHALKITNLDIDIDAKEVPIMDGSALEFYETISTVGTRELKKELRPIIITEPLTVEDGDTMILCLPSEETIFAYRLSYDNFIGHHFHSFNPKKDTFKTDIAPARTYGFYKEVEALRKKGLALGGSFDNAVVIGEDAYMNKLRFDNELCRHKLLDLYGDIWTLGRPIQGHVIGIKSGHAVTMKLIQQHLCHL
jgi:UDP-3-O-[3-hydroxymyristoyl] N-acetylglucosamine deacetylase